MDKSKFKSEKPLNSEEISSKQREDYQHYRGLEKNVQSEKFEEKKSLKKSGDIYKQVDKESELIETIAGREPEEDSILNKEIKSPASAESEKEMSDLREVLGESQMKQLESEAFSRLMNAVRKIKKLEGAKHRLKQYEEELIRRLYEDVDLKESLSVNERISLVSKKITRVNEVLKKISRESPEAFKAFHLLRLRDYKRQFEESGMIETPWIEDHYSELTSHVRKTMEGNNRVCTLLGPTGSGKTVMAERVAKTLSPNGDYEFVSAHSKMDPDDLLWRQGIQVESITPETAPEIAEKAKQAFRENNPNMDEVELIDRERYIEEVVKNQAGQKAFKTEIIPQAIARAASEGKVVVVDEFNYLPPQTLAALNKLLDAKAEKRAGEKVKVDIDDESGQTQSYEVTEGFGVILTGNIGSEYLGRNQKLDPALYSRILSGVIQYDHPPQELKGSLENSIKTDNELAEGQEPPPRELFLASLVQLIDEKGNLSAPIGAMEDIWHLSQTVSRIQQIAAGKDPRELGVDSTMLQNISTFDFKSLFLSFRNLNQVVREWKGESYSQTLDHYLFENIIRPASVLKDNEAAQMFYIFKNFGGFFQGEEFEDVKVNSTSWSLSGVGSVPQKIGSDDKIRHYIPKEIVEAASGEETPSYEDLDTKRAGERREDKSQEEYLAEVERQLNILIRELEAEKFVEDACREK
ncbi:MAG: AAA family ATPase [Patescibacteria group bacterium]